MAANSIYVQAMTRFFTREEIDSAYLAALQAGLSRQTEVVITSAAFDGGNSSGQIAGDPSEVMAACQAALDQLDGRGPAAPVTHANFSSRRASWQE